PGNVLLIVKKPELTRIHLGQKRLVQEETPQRNDERILVEITGVAALLLPAAILTGGFSIFF
ncbi:MAG: hypothetical protein ACYTEQ_24950, partial [Planctomycetota bacterium]